MGQAINKFFDTSLGKSLQTFLWAMAAYAVTVLIGLLAKVEWTDQLLALGIPGLINWGLYTAKVFIDKEVPNFPNSQPMMLVPRTDLPSVVIPPVTVPKAKTPEDPEIDQLIKELDEQINTKPAEAQPEETKNSPIS